MLLFESKETPYKDYNVLPSLMGKDVKDRKEQDTNRVMDEVPLNSSIRT